MTWTKLKLDAVGAAAVALTGGGLLHPPAAAQEGGKADDPRPKPKAVDTSRQPTSDDLRAALLKLETKGWDALKNGNLDPAAASMAPDFVAVLAEGKRLDRDGVLKELAQVKLKDYRITDAKVVALSPDAAVLTYRVRSEYTADGMTVKDHLWVSSGWARRDGKWVNVTYQETPVKVGE